MAAEVLQQGHRTDDRLRVLITIDTEVYPMLPDWRQDRLRRDLERDIYGETVDGSPVGLLFQLEVFRRYGIKAVFFIESLFAHAVGMEPLRRIVGLVREAGHEVQLHLHPEWLAWMERPPVPSAGRNLISQFDADEQLRLIGVALDTLRDAGADGVVAFRAGDFAANADTLAAVRSHGLRYDASMNRHYAYSLPEFAGHRDATQPFPLQGLCELPVAYWRTAPFGTRPAQFASSSLAELKAALNHAHARQWHSFVIVSHSFELLNKRRRRPARPVADAVVKARFVGLCRFLDRHRDRFVTAGFRDLPDGADAPPQKPPLPSPWPRTLLRMAQQAYRRVA